MTDLAFPSGLPSGQGFVRLRELRDCLQPREVMHWRDLAVDGLAFHSAEVRPGNLFFAIRGTKNDGTVFAQQAIARGAVAVVADEPLSLSVPVLVVDNVREALADAACFYYRDPSKAISVVGVTGTNGKTTTGHLIRSCLQADRRQVGLLGTIAYEFGGRRIPGVQHDAGSRSACSGYLREMADRFASACVMEVSSHSARRRIACAACDFAVGVFTEPVAGPPRLPRRRWRRTARPRRELFQALRPGFDGGAATATIPRSQHMAEELCDRCQHHVGRGTSPDADIRAEDDPAAGHRRDAHAHRHAQRRTPSSSCRSVGSHNVENALAAAATAHGARRKPS